MKKVTVIILSLISIIYTGIFMIISTTDFSGRIKISVYYESLCPFSISFITEEFYPNYKDLQGYIRMDWIPYGWADQSFINDSWRFTCQHGNGECKANRYQVCALTQNKGQVAEVEFVNCVLSLNDPSITSSIENCAQLYGFNWNDIIICSNNEEGDELFAQLGKRTHKLNPEINVMPTIIFNDHFDQLLNKNAKESFLKATCSQIPHPRPDICFTIIQY